MAFNGSGTFNRLYRWVNDAANGLFISAPKFDAEMDGMATALSNCITRDGQSPPTADLPMGGHKVTGLASGVAGNDAVTVSQMNAANSAWSLSLRSGAAYVSPTVLRLLGADLTYSYHAGRRVWMDGGSPTIGTIAISTYSAPDTLLTIVVDNEFGSVINPGVNTIVPGLMSYKNYPEYLSPRTAVYATANITSSASSGTFSTVPFDATHTGGIDTLSEFTGTPTYRFTAKYPGRHRFVGNVAVQATASISNPGGGITMQVNGANVAPVVCYTNFPGAYGPGLWMNMPFHFLVNLNAGDYVSVLASFSGSTWGTGTLGTNLIVDRIV